MGFPNILLGETIGTMLLILLGDGVVANVLLNKTKGNNSGWIVITTAWALAVYVGAFVSAPVSGAHLNPAVTLGLAIAGNTAWANVPIYWVGEFLGAFIGAFLVWLHYYPHWKDTDPGLQLAVYCTAPAIRNTVMNFISEVIGTFVLMFGILGIKGVTMSSGGSAVPLSMGALGIIPVAFLVWVIGLSLGGTTGYAINPARDLGPRIMHAILPMPGKGGSDWGYSWIPVVGPLVGAAIAAVLYGILAPMALGF
jgi:glycerol uptake facilitator protein